MISVFLFFPRGQADHELPLHERVALETAKADNSAPEQTTAELQSEPVEQSPAIIIVDVKGAVERPNVYSLQEGQRLIDAVTAAGGYTAEADSRLLNHAQLLVDEEVIYVPLVGEEPPVFEQPSSEAATNDGAGSVVNINTADESELMTLTGIGPAKAAAIVSYRTEQGYFQKIEDLMNVSGIGEKTFETLADTIAVK